MTSRNKVMQTCTPCTVVSRSALMSLIMTFMFEPAKLQMNWARASGTSIGRSDLLGTGWLAVALVMPAAGRPGRAVGLAQRLLSRSRCVRRVTRHE